MLRLLLLNNQTMNFNFITSLLPVLAFMLPVTLGAAGHPPTPDQDFEKTYSETPDQPLRRHPGRNLGP